MMSVVHHHRRRPRTVALVINAFFAVALFLPLLALCSSDLLSSSPSGNGLWDDLVGKCGAGPSNTVDCVRSRLYHYVSDTFESDMNITDGIRFTRNSNDYDTMCPRPNVTAGTYRESRAPEMGENEVEDGWEEFTDELYNKGTKYLVTHDFEASVPGFLGGGGDQGAKVRLSPKRILPDGGIILRMDVLPAVERDVRSPRFMKKMIKQLFKKKLMSSGMALMLIIKLIKIKLMFLLPLLIGAGAAKKILLKVLLFVFPPLAHLFKLCSYYHHHASKFYHYHHHKVKHHHHHLKIPVPVPIPSRPPHEYYSAGPALDHPPGPYDSPAEYLSNSDYYNRNGPDSVADHGDELASWGLNEYSEGMPAPYDLKYTHSSSPAQYENKPSSYGPPSSYGSPPSPYVEKYIKRGDENHALTRQPAPPPPSSQLTNHDPVFTPIVQRLDEIFNEVAVSDEPCREKLVCRMYGNPIKFSPHSNLVSAQLSSQTAANSGARTTISADAARLWRYVQAAKEGQNGEDCRSLFPNCHTVGL
ncbi:Protein of unknown function DUF1676 [Cinara cedri]|uniref:Uncharacterized protein n=1 Tax=Cinara cedri TaxID=506608 RepID=A0A5E4ND30_9HEMI|nr:Protein of unknown function DUF1676 [Cinara cedri]